ncbi:MAG: UbiA family prenyltransferase [Bacteroidota bacterium]
MIHRKQKREMTAISRQMMPAKILSLDFLRGYLITMRPYLLFVSGITGVVGLSFAPKLPIITSLVLSAAFFFSYGFGQALTDCFQTDTDALSSPYRPLTQGRLRRRDVMGVSLIGLSLVGIIFALYSLINIVLSTIAVVGLATYTYFKRRWWGGPLWNAWIVALVCVIAYMAGSGAAGVAVTWSVPFIATLAVVFFGYANFVLSGYFKDISADKTTGYNTLPVVFGMKASAVVCDIFALLTLIACVIALYSVTPTAGIYEIRWGSLAFAVPGVIVLVRAQMLLHKVCSEDDAHKSIALVVHAYILLLSSIVITQKPGWVIAIALFYCGFVITMKSRPVKQQI